MYIGFGITMLPVEQFQKESHIISARRTETILIEGGDFFLQRGPQIFFAECLFSTKIDGGAPKRRFLLRLLDLLLCLVFFLALRLGHGALTASRSRQGQAKERNEK